MSQPLVDILLATCNGERFLAPQLQSLLAQSHAHWRLWVSDDGSRDGTRDILQRNQAALGDRLVILPGSGPGAGAMRNFERLMQASADDGRAAWIAFCDQDDVWQPHKIERLLAAMRALEKEVGAATPCLVHSDLAVVDEQLRVIAPSFAAHERIDPAQVNPRTLLSVNLVTGCATLINRALLELALPLPAEALMHDWWLALLSGGGARRYLAEPLVLYRQHGRNQLGARDRGLASRLQRLAREGTGVWRRVRRLGRGTRAQAMALQRRLRERQRDDAWVADYLAWRRAGLLHRLARYRTYYVGPELDRLSRLLLWT